MGRAAIPSVGFFSPRTLQTATQVPNNTLTTTLFVNNLHCASCVTHAKDTISPLRGIHKVDVNLLGHVICVQHEPGLTPKIADVLIDAAFEVSHVTTSDTSGRVISTHDVSSSLAKVKNRHTFPLTFMNSARRKHIANCKACQIQEQKSSFLSRALGTVSRKRKRSSPADDDSDPEQGRVPEVTEEKPVKDVAVGPDHFTAIISVGGMTCPSCTNNITAQLQELDFVEDIEVSLMSNSATVKFQGSEAAATKIVETIEDCGFDASLNRVERISQQKPCKAVFTVEGMTCGSCVANVTSGLEAIDGVTAVSVNLQGSCAVLEMSSESIKDKVLETIEDLGFEGALAEIQDLNTTKTPETQYRTVEFELLGMYCPMCPTNVTSKIKSTFAQDVDILSEPSIKAPRITLRYKPNPPNLNIRMLKAAIEDTDSSITAKLYHPPTMEDRSREVQKREWWRILCRLLFSLLAAVPSFIIGVLYMSLLPASNSTRMWFEQPIWAGNAKRMDWAMFITSSFVMFYGADIFHRRAAKEVWSLWRPKSKVPILRRFYRFGSMNLLISAGTAVAYFSSLSILVMEATSSARTESMGHGLQDRHTTTYFDTVVFLTLFILCGKFLQAQSKAKTGEAVAELGKLRPTTALLVDRKLLDAGEDARNSLVELSTDMLEIGDVVCIRFGESPPTDGIIEQDGIFLFDESSLTGESKPVKKVRGDTILTGSVNKSDPVRITVTELGGKSMLDQIIAIVRGGQSKRAPVERFADIMTSYFTPVITLIAILTWVLWLGLGESGALPRHWLDVEQGGWAFWSVEFAIAVFVVACPCGLGLAAPTALFVGGGLAAKAGILVQGGGEAFQEASQLNAIVFDKTGTLTEGQMRVTDCHSLSNQDQPEMFQLMLRLAALLEESSTHPIAKAIVAFCEGQRNSESEPAISVVDVQEVSGCGMKGTFDVVDKSSGQTTRYEASLGNERLLLHSNGVDAESPKHKMARVTVSDPALASVLGSFQGAGCSTAILSIRTVSDSGKNKEMDTFTPAAVFAITDPIRAEAVTVLRAFRSQNIAVHMCTGDNETTARAIASQLDIPVTNIRAGVLPQDKAAYIHDLQQVNDKRQIIAFVGDGTNDAPALTAADVSIALSSGSDIAAKSASFILLNSNLDTILHLVRLAKRVFLRVKLNFAWAAVYNVALIPVAAGVFFPIAQWRLSPAWAALAMALSSVSVVLSSLALRLPEIRFRQGLK